MSAAATTTRTFQQTQNVTTVRTATVPQQIARYLADDLLVLVHDARIDLARDLDLPPDQYLTDPELLVELLCHDIELMVSQELISGVHFLLHGDQPDGGAYRLGYHAEYQIVSTRSVSGDPLEEFGGRITVPDNAMLWRNFTLLLDWKAPLSEVKLDEIRPPTYIFEWHIPQERFDGSHLVRFVSGEGLGTVLARIQHILPGSLPN